MEIYSLLKICVIYSYDRSFIIIFIYANYGSAENVVSVYLIYHVITPFPFLTIFIIIRGSHKIGHKLLFYQEN